MGKKLLVADDSVTIQKVIKLALSNASQNENYEILSAQDGDAALRILEDAVANSDPLLVLLDINLPGLNAFELKAKFDEFEASKNGASGFVQFILLHSAFEKVDEGKAKQAGLSARLIKPFDPAHLRKVLSSAGEMSALAPKGEASVHGDITNVASEIPDAMETTLPPLEFDSLPPLESEIPMFESMPAPEATPLPPLQGSSLGASGSSEDIQSLTQSTIEMTGLDEIQERRSPPAEVKPEEVPGFSGWQLDDQRKRKQVSGMSIPNVKPKVSPVAKPNAPLNFDTGGSRILEDLNLLKPPQKIEPVAPLAARAPAVLSETNSADFKSALTEQLKHTLESESFHQMIQRSVEKSVETALLSAIREVLPKMAEKLLKKEIEDLLKE